MLSGFWPTLTPVHHLIVNISGIQQNIITRKTELQTKITTVVAYLILCIMAHKRQRLDHSFDRPSINFFRHSFLGC